MGYDEVEKCPGVFFTGYVLLEPILSSRGLYLVTVYQRVPMLEPPMLFIDTLTLAH